MLLTNLPQHIQCKKIYQYNKKNLSFNHISTNSKNITRFSILVILDTLKFKEKYIREAISKGAVAIISKNYYKKININQYIVNDIETTLTTLLYKLFPKRPHNSVAITGTNGKTSVAWYVSQICLLNKIPVKTYGTLGFYINNKKKEQSFLTTPNKEILHQAAFSRVKNKFNFVFEASSHAIKQDRIKNFPINIAAITNISQDHLDYHKTIKDYRKTKFNLFTKNLDPNGYAILNDKIENINFLKKNIKNKIKIISYGNKNSDINLTPNNKDLIIKFFKKKYILKSIIFNQIDLENLECALACCFCLKLKINHILLALKRMKSPPGRLEKIINKNNYNIFIDYAHTPDALKKVLLSLTYNRLKPNIVFGCGGNRDQNKRSKMGFIANKYANKIFITDDNPRNENPKRIRKDILNNCKNGIEISNRRKAIFIAVKELKKKEVLIIAGKGHEKYQIIKNNIKKFDDKEVVRLALKNK